MGAESVEPLYVDAGTVAAWLSVSEKTVYRLAASEPTLPVVRLNGVVRFHRERVLRWLRDREQSRVRSRRSAVLSPRPAETG